MKNMARFAKLAMVSAVALSGGVAFALHGTAPVAALQVAGQARAPLTPDQMVAAARPGATIVLPASTGGSLSIINKQFSPAIRIDASSATLSSIVIRNSSGVYIDRGRIVGPGGRSLGINVVDSQDVRVSNLTISGANKGVVLSRSSNVVISSNRLVGLLADGINIATSWNVQIVGNECRDFRAMHGLLDEDGNVIDTDHPDCIQAWSRPPHRPTGNILVERNRGYGRMGGIFFGNHVRNGVDDGGFDDVVIRNNTMAVAFPHGVSLYAGRNSTIRDNILPAAVGVIQRNGQPAVATVRSIGSTRTVVCGNRIERRPNDVSSRPCEVPTGI